MKPFSKMMLASASLTVLTLATLAYLPATPGYAASAEKTGVTEPADKATPPADPMEKANGDTKKVLEQLQKLGGKPIETLTPEVARQQPTPADAVNALLLADGKNPEELKADMKVASQDKTYPAGEGTQPVRVYIPEHDAEEKLPVIVYYHGGGFVIADINIYDAAPRSMAKLAKAIVVSPEYRHGPEHKFPAAHEDAFAAYKWAIANAAQWGADTSRIAVMGESAGGNLAANVAIMARDQKVQAPVYMGLVYPVAGNDMNNESYTANANAKPLNKAMMAWFVKHATSKPEDVNDSRINLVAANLAGLPPATVITAEIDPLMSEGKLLADKLNEAGVKTDYKNYDGVTHEFFGMAAVVGEAKDAQKKLAGDIDNAFDDAKKD